MKPKHLFISFGNQSWTSIDSWKSQAWKQAYISQFGHYPCRMMRMDYAQLLQWIARAVYWETQDVPGSPVLVVGDLSNQTECEGHPGGTHRDGFTFDHNYYTYGHNITQYRPHGSQEPLEVMWKNLQLQPVGISYYDGQLDTKVFNWKRNWCFWKKLILAFSVTPDYAEHINRSYSLIIMVHERIRDYVLRQLEGTPDYELAKKLQDLSHYNHHIHAHVQLADIDWEAEI